MKLFKTIIIIALAVILTLSLSLNIFLCVMFELSDIESFKQALLAKELLDSFSEAFSETTETTLPVD
jgi:hypothetical protein